MHCFDNRPSLVVEGPFASRSIARKLCSCRCFQTLFDLAYCLRHLFISPFHMQQKCACQFSAFPYGLRTGCICSPILSSDRYKSIYACVLKTSKPTGYIITKTSIQLDWCEFHAPIESFTPHLDQKPTVQAQPDPYWYHAHDIVALSYKLAGRQRAHACTPAVAAAYLTRLQAAMDGHPFLVTTFFLTSEL